MFLLFKLLLLLTSFSISFLLKSNFFLNTPVGKFFLVYRFPSCFFLQLKVFPVTVSFSLSPDNLNIMINDCVRSLLFYKTNKTVANNSRITRVVFYSVAVNFFLFL